MNNISISMQKDPSLEHVQLITVEDFSIKRGCVGIAKKGNVNAAITFFEAADVIVR